MGLIQTIALILEERSKTQLATDMAAAGAKGVAALRTEFQRKMGELKADFSQGLIDEPTFRAQARRVADAFNQEIIKRMDVLKAAGRDTSKEYAELGRQIKIASDTGIQSGGLLTSAWGKVKTFATGLGATIAAAFTVRAVADFVKDSVTAAVTVGRSWREIGNAVSAVGGDFVKMRPQIEDTVERIAKSLAFDDEEIRDGLTRFVRATGSVTLGLRGIEVAAKLARAGNISVEQATNLLVRALETGNVRGLTPFVGNLKGTKDVLGDVSLALGDVAATVSPFEKGTRMLSEAWEDLQVAVGNMVISGPKGQRLRRAANGPPGIHRLDSHEQGGDQCVGEWWDPVRNGGLQAVRHAGGWHRQGNRDHLEILQQCDPDRQGDVGEHTDRLRHVHPDDAGLVLKLQNGMLRLAESMGLDGVADKVRASMQQTSGYIGDLGTFIADKTVEMRRHLGGDDTSATQTKSLGGALAANTKAGTDKAAGSIDRFTTGGKAKIKELSDSTKQHMEDMSEAYDAAGQAFTDGHVGPILQGKDAVLKAHKEMQEAQHKTAEELQQDQENIQSAYIETGDAAKRGGIMSVDATREVAEAKAAEREEIERTNAASQNYAEEYWKRDVPLFLQGQSAQQDALHKTRDAGKDAADTTKDSWLDALG